jgi:HEAT repeat protein
MPIRLGIALALIAATGLAARGEDLDLVMYSDPEVPVSKRVKTHPEGIAELWLTALKRPERELRTRAAQAVAAAHESGIPGLTSAIGPLRQLIEEPNQHPAVLVSAARALVVLDARDAAPAFLLLARSDQVELRDIVEPALARWDYRPARDLWIERINLPNRHTRAVASAARWLGAVREERAVPRLKELALAEHVDAPTRLAAARALGEIQSTGLAADAARLAADATPRGMTGRLVAASLLKRHDGDEVVRFLQGLVRDTEPAVAMAALARLVEIDTRHVLPVVEAALASPDAGVRALGARALFDHPSAANIRLLGARLSDAHPDVRIRARTFLRDLAAKWRTDVIDAGVRTLAARDDWRGQEQAAILLATLDHKPATEGLLKLLSSNRSEVLVAVGWGLRKLAVPETLPTVLDHVRARHADLLRGGKTGGIRGASSQDFDLHLSHLIQLLGQLRYEPADPALRALVPRFTKPGMPPAFTPVGPEARAAAIWSLGLIRAGKPQGQLVTLIEGRLTGDAGMGPDDERVRRMAAISLGRLKAQQSLDELRLGSQGTEPNPDVVANACRWAVSQLTGEKVPPTALIPIVVRDWFLVPHKE